MIIDGFSDMIVDGKDSNDFLAQKGANSVKKRTWIGWGSGSGGKTKCPGGRTTTVPCSRPKGCLGRTRDGSSSGLLGQFQGRAGIRPKAKKKKKENPFTISNLFDSKTNSNLHPVPTCKIKYESTHQYKRKYTLV
jgi:hypothetical protein